MAAKIVIIHVIIFGAIYLSMCEQFQMSKDNLDKALVGHSVLQVNGTNLHECARKCVSFAICKSFDYDRTEHSCNLNDVDRSSVDPSESKTKKGSIFSDITEWPSSMAKKCGTRPCQKNQRCLVNGDSFVCRDISNCPINQQLDNGKIEVLASDQNRFHDKAAVKCDVGYTPNQREVECQASGQWQPAICLRLRSDCKEILDEFPQASSGQFEIELWKTQKILTVNCDMETDGGGWTLIHRRIDGSVDFNRPFKEYEDGFGNADGEFWLGLKYIKELAEQKPTKLRLDVTTENNEAAYETFQDFKLTEGINYTLNIGSRKASAVSDEQYGLLHNNKYQFSTFDRDLDRSSNVNCAERYQGGWWYNSCTNIMLNGLYQTRHFHRAFYETDALKMSSIMLKEYTKLKVQKAKPV